MSEIAEHFHAVEQEIEAAKARRSAGKDEPVGLIAVTKNHGVEAMREAIDAGAAIIGENRVQEAAQKKETLERNVSWHLIGHLQTNKAKQAVRLFDLIHSVDSEHLLDAVNDHSNLTVIISDNLTTGMTGGQDSAGTSKYEAICLGLGVEPEHLHVVVPLPKNMPEITRILREEIEYNGVSVIIPRRECIQTAARHARERRIRKEEENK